MSWKLVPGYEGHYAVSDKGVVYSLRRERELKPKIDRYGYKVVTLTVHGHSKCFTVHRLVAKCCRGVISQTHNIEWRYYDEVRRMA